MSETKLTASKVLDSALWLAYFLDGKYKEIIEKEETFILSAISLFEIKKKIKGSSLAYEHQQRSFGFLKEKTLLISVDEKMANEAVSLALKHKLGTADALIYATTLLQKATLFTTDNDFRGLPSVEVV